MNKRHRHQWYKAGLVFASLFIAMALMVSFSPEILSDIDATGVSAAHVFQSGLWLPLFLSITFLGSTAGVIIACLVAAYFWRRSPGLILRLVTTVILSTASVQYFKTAFSRVRPESLSWLITEPSFSFPSGHATAVASVYGFFLCTAYVRSEKMSRVRSFVIAACALVIFLVGFSRLVLGVHFTSDVLAGYMLGAFWVCIGISAPFHRRHGKEAVPML
jgi:membrane-associated phospholipid phosphatase